MRLFLTSALLLAVLPALQAAEPLGYDHYNPVVLNEYAARAVYNGDTRTALILLERAARIFPGDPRIAANLETLRAWWEGRASREPERSWSAQQPASPANPPLPPPEPPDLWPPP